MEHSRITIDTKNRGKFLGDLFGIFFEDLNHAADGGLYAEMVQNRSFEFSPIDHPDYNGLTAWEKIETDGKVEIFLMEGDAINKRNPHFLRIHVVETGKDCGIKNNGFSQGMYYQKNKKYIFSCYARCPQNNECQVKVSLRTKENHVIADKSFIVQEQWEKTEFTLIADETTDQGYLAITITGGTLDLDFVSLFPEDTFNKRRNGLRPDLAEALAEMKPKFMRFPGGCLVHDGSLNENDRDSLYRWKNTLGAPESRPSRRNNWKYNQTLGLGYYEYFLFCEDIGAKPVPVLPAAYDPHHQKMIPLEELETWVQEALDLIEFANGDLNTKWGKYRGELGHDKPFNLEYVAIGNEEVGIGFRERFPYFVKAIKEKYPEIKIIGSSGPFSAGNEYQAGWECARKTGANLVDEHYYMTPEWFIANIHRYDSFSQNGPKVFLGEYATCWNSGNSALTEAAYMTQMQNNIHAVKMACYAPLLCHRDYENWKPDLIWFDNTKICKSVNYEVQKLFMNHQGDELLSYQFETEVKNEKILDYRTKKRGDLYVQGNQAIVQFYDIWLYDEDRKMGKRLPDIETKEDLVPVLLEKNSPENFSIRFHAKEISGFKGFRLYFGYKTEKNNMCWLIGGWENQDSAFIEDINGKGSFLTQNSFSLERGREYDFELRVKGKHIEGWINGKLFQTTELTDVEVEPLYITASREKITKDIIVKIVNLRKTPITTELCFKGMDPGKYICEFYELLESSCLENKDFPGVENADVCHKISEVSVSEENGVLLNFHERSVTVLRLKKKQK